MISNVYALLGIHRMSKTDLARALGWDGATVTRILNEDPKKASREWKIADILEVGRVFHLDDPFDLTRPLSEIVGSGPNSRATGTGGTSGRPSSYDHRNVSSPVLRFPQVATHSGELPTLATVIPLQRGVHHHPRPSRTVAV